MLKIIYLDSELWLEPLSGTMEALVTQHSLLSLRLGQPLIMQPSRGSIPLPADLPGVELLLQQSRCLATIDITYCDSQWVEITFQGIWIADDINCDQGIFVTECDRDLEDQILSLWQWGQSRLTTGSTRQLPKAC